MGVYKGWNLLILLAFSGLSLAVLTLIGCGLRIGSITGAGGDQSLIAAGYQGLGVSIAEFEFAADVNGRSPTLKLIDSRVRGSVTRNDITLTSSSVIWDAGSHILSGNVRLTNGTTALLYNVKVVVELITARNVEVRNASGTVGGKPFWSHGNNLATVATTSAVTWKFYDP